MAKRFITPFAEAGDRAEMPDVPTGSDSNYQTGYPSEYEEDPVTNPSTAKFVERDKSNQLFNDITANIKEWQEHVFPEFITSDNNGGVPFSYKKNSIVTYLGVDYSSNVDSNESTPPSSKWEVFSTSLIDDLSQPHIFDTVVAFKDSPIEFPDGKTIHLNDRNADFTKITGTGTATGNKIIASTNINQSVVLNRSIIIDPKAYGCKGDDSTINTVILNEMFTDIDGGHSTVVLSDGDSFLIDGRVAIGSNTTLTGKGEIKYTNELCYIDILEKDNVTVSEITIDGDFDSYVNVAGVGDTRSIWVNKGSTNVLIDNVKTSKVLRQAIYIGSGSAGSPVAPENVEVRSCTITDIGSPLDPISANFGNGIVISAGKKVWIHHNLIKRIHGTGGINGEGITLTRQDITVENNIIDTVTSTTVSPASARGIRFNGTPAAGEENTRIHIRDNTVLNTAGSGIYTNDMKDVQIINNTISTCGVNCIELLGEDSGTIKVLSNKCGSFSNIGVSVTNGAIVNIDSNEIINGAAGSSAGLLYRKGVNIRALSVDKNIIDNIQTDGMQLSGYNFTCTNNKISNIGQVGAGNHRAISTPSGALTPANDQGVIDCNNFDASTGSVQAFIFAETNRWVNTTYGQSNNIIGDVEEVRSNFSTTFQMIGAPYPNKPDVGATGSAATWAKYDKIKNLTPDAGDYEGWVCVTAGTPGVWKGQGLIEA